MSQMFSWMNDNAPPGQPAPILTTTTPEITPQEQQAQRAAAEYARYQMLLKSVSTEDNKLLGQKSLLGG